MRVLLISAMRNEGPHLLEWFAHHKRIGFTDFFIGQNDSEDYTREILQVLHELGEITYHDNSHIWVKQKMRLVHQFQVNYACAQAELYKNADWAIMIDGDEFINIHAPLQTIRDVIEASPSEAEAILLYWRNFGSSGHKTIPEDMLTRAFTSCEPLENFDTNWKLYKTIFRPQKFARAGVHFPNGQISEDPEIFDASGRPRKNNAHRDDRDIPAGAQNLATINHYRVLDVTRFISKHLREQNCKRKNKLGLSYWKKGDFNEAQDHTLAQHANATRMLMDELDARSDGALYELGALSVQYHKDQLAHALANDPDAKAVYDRVCGYIDAHK